MEELAVRSLSNSLSAYNTRVQKLSRVQEKILSKEGSMITLRNALKLYQNYKAMESCSETLLTAIETCESRVLSSSNSTYDGASEDLGELFVGRVSDDYLVLIRRKDGTISDYFPSDRTTESPRNTYPPERVSVYCTLRKEKQNEYRARHPVLALVDPSTNRMLPAQMSRASPSRRRKTNDSSGKALPLTPTLFHVHRSFLLLIPMMFSRLLICVQLD